MGKASREAALPTPGLEFRLQDGTGQLLLRVRGASRLVTVLTVSPASRRLPCTPTPTRLVLTPWCWVWASWCNFEIHTEQCGTLALSLGEPTLWATVHLPSSPRMGCQTARDGPAPRDPWNPTGLPTLRLPPLGLPTETTLPLPRHPPLGTVRDRLSNAVTASSAGLAASRASYQGPSFQDARWTLAKEAS